VNKSEYRFLGKPAFIFPSAEALYELYLIVVLVPELKCWVVGPTQEFRDHSIGEMPRRAINASIFDNYFFIFH
jgi:hypothetical protein